jgi:hypothetical protein
MKYIYVVMAATAAATAATANRIETFYLRNP